MGFLPKVRQKWIFLEKRVLTFFKYNNYLLSCKKSEKTTDPFMKKMLNWQMNRQTVRPLWFYRTLHRTGVQKLAFHSFCITIFTLKQPVFHITKNPKLITKHSRFLSTKCSNFIKKHVTNLPYYKTHKLLQNEAQQLLNEDLIKDWQNHFIKLKLA